MTEPRDIDREPLRRFFAERIGGDSSLLPADADSLVDAGILDSFGLADLVAYLEDTYGIRIPEKDIALESFESVERIAAYVAAAERR